MALLLFTGLVLSGVAAVGLLPHVTKGKVNSPEAVTPAAGDGDDEASFFYDAVGRSPQESAAQAPARGHLPGGKVSYTLEIRVAASRDDAERVIDELHGRGIEAYYTPLARAGKVVYRVRRGIFPSQKEADRAALAMKQEHAVDAKVVKLQ